MFIKFWRNSFLAAALLMAGVAPAEVVRVEISERSDVLAGKSFGPAGTFERLVGKVYFEVDPKAPANRLISDIDYAPVNSRGRVEFSADLYVILPKEPSKGNGTVFYEVVNRGRKGILNKFNLSAGSFDPRTAEEFGDGFLLEQGYTLLWMGWQYDVPPEPNLMRFFAPAAKDGDKPITGLVRSDYVPDQRVRSFHLADRTHIPYPIINPDDPSVQLTVRDRIDAPRRVIPRERWKFGRDENGQFVPNRTHVYMAEGFQPGKVYEIVYKSQDPKLVGLGLAATRDIISFAKYGIGGDPEMPLGSLNRHIERAIGFGSSQSGRFLRTFLYFGFNKDEKGREAFDGVWPSVAGGGRGSFNHRFAQPSRDARPHFNFLYPTDVFPFTGIEQTDPETGLTDGILKRTINEKAVPKIFYTNSSYEYYGRSASLIHTSVDGQRDFGPAENTRIYLVSGAQHGPGRFPPSRRGTQNMANANDYRPVFRALLVAMNQWIVEGKEPPASQYPKIADDQLVPLGAVQFPKIPGVAFPTRMHHAYRVDYGPQFRSKRVITIEPPKVGKAFPMGVPQVNQDGNETSGVIMPVVQVPLATYAGWNLRAPEIGAPQELYSMVGSYIPFPVTKAEREKTGDPRMSMQERYEDRQEYLDKVSAAARGLVQGGYVLDRDVSVIMEQAAEQWDHYLGSRSGE